jgi:hypothetical protein
MGFVDSFAGAMPYAGPIYHGAKAIYHSGAAMIDVATGDQEHAEDNVTHGMVELVEAVPGLGTALSVGEAVYDNTEGDKPSEEYLYGEDDDATESAGKTSTTAARRGGIGRRSSVWKHWLGEDSRRRRAGWSVTSLWRVAKRRSWSAART